MDIVFREVSSDVVVNVKHFEEDLKSLLTVVSKVKSFFICVLVLVRIPLSVVITTSQTSGHYLCVVTLIEGNFCL